MQTQNWLKHGIPWIWLNAAAVALSLLAVLALILVLSMNGLKHFWPSKLYSMQYTTDQNNDREVYHIYGKIADKETISRNRLVAAGFTHLPPHQQELERYLVKVGNRELNGQDFVWLLVASLNKVTAPVDLVSVERWQWGDFYGRVTAVTENETIVASSDAGHKSLQHSVNEYLKRSQALQKKRLALEKKELAAINRHLNKLRLEERKLEFKRTSLTPETIEKTTREIEAQRQQAYQSLSQLTQQISSYQKQLESYGLVMTIADGQEVTLSFADIVTLHYPNDLNIVSRAWHWFHNLWRFLKDDPREANTEGGVYPAIIGTVVMVLLMSIFVTPFGVVTAIYLHEYARQGFLTQLVRITVRNLAGVPSIVYGVFGLGFFVYFLGGSIDQLFFPEKLPAPTFGTPGLFWATLTLALLTLPVVIVSTEEGLSRVPKTIRSGSLALGATRAETLWHVIIPASSPAIMTGLILAMARAAGEVAPLMLVGVVKLAPALPIDSTYPFVHLERKFMHLGFHIYDVGFQSPNVEASRPLVYATALLLVALVFILNLAAIIIRNRLRDYYKNIEN